MVMEYFQYTSYISYLLCFVDDDTLYIPDIYPYAIEILWFEKSTLWEDISVIVLVWGSSFLYYFFQKSRFPYMASAIEDDGF